MTDYASVGVEPWRHTVVGDCIQNVEYEMDYEIKTFYLMHNTVFSNYYVGIK